MAVEGRGGGEEEDVGVDVGGGAEVVEGLAEVLTRDHDDLESGKVVYPGIVGDGTADGRTGDGGVPEDHGREGCRADAGGDGGHGGGGDGDGGGRGWTGTDFVHGAMVGAVFDNDDDGRTNDRTNSGYGHGEEEHEGELRAVVDQTLGHDSLRPRNLVIVEGKKGWTVHVDLVVLREDGNVYDALFLAARTALVDARVPRTRGVSGSEFELVDGDGVGLEGTWPVCVTLNVLRSGGFFLDGTRQEEESTETRVVVISSASMVYGVRVLGSGELGIDLLCSLIKVCLSLCYSYQY